MKSKIIDGTILIFPIIKKNQIKAYLVLKLYFPIPCSLFCLEVFLRPGSAKHLILLSYLKGFVGILFLGFPDLVIFTENPITDMLRAKIKCYLLRKEETGKESSSFVNFTVLINTNFSD